MPAERTRGPHPAGLPKVVVFAAVYWPGFKAGGPVRTLRNQVAALRGHVDFWIITADRDLGESACYGTVPLNQWTEIDGAHVFYADAAHQRPAVMRRIVEDLAPDVVYVNSFFNPVFSIRPILLRRFRGMAADARWVIGTRGELSSGALSIKSWKKRPFMAVARWLGLHRGMIWQASSEYEAADIEKTIGVDAATIHVAPDPVDAVSPSLTDRTWHEPATPLDVCFLSRISPMKNLAYAIDVLRLVQRPVRLHVYGPVGDAAYWAACQQRPKKGDGLEMKYHGQIEHDHVRGMLERQDLLFLPTMGENFGHVIFEALAAGVPVLVSDRTPWRDLDAAGVGWVRPLDDASVFVSIIESFSDAPAADKAAMAARAHAYAARVAESPEVTRQNLALFKP